MEPRYFHGGVIAGVHSLTASLSTPSEFSAGLGLIPSLQAVVEPRYFHEEIITGFQSLSGSPSTPLSEFSAGLKYNSYGVSVLNV